MKHPLRLTGLVLTLTLIGSIVGWTGRAAAGDDDSPLIGKPAPDLQGDFALNGTATRLADLKGKIVVVEFWAVWCTPCLATVSDLRDWQKEFQDDNVVVLGVTKYQKDFGFNKLTGAVKAGSNLAPQQERDMLKDFARYHKMTYPLLVLPDESWARAAKDYNIRGIPTFVVIDRKGNVRLVRTGNETRNMEAIRAEVKKVIEQG